MPAPRTPQQPDPSTVVRLHAPTRPDGLWTVRVDENTVAARGGSPGRAIDQLVNWAILQGGQVALDGLGLAVVKPQAPELELEPLRPSEGEPA